MRIESLRLRVLLGGALLCVAGASTAFADSNETNGTFSLQLQNDRIAATDRHYTHGTRLSWVSDSETDGPEWVRDALELLYPLAEVRGGRVGFALGQSIYTPEDTDAVSLVVEDRPYAGWLYGAVSLHAEATHQLEWGKLGTLDLVELSLGIVGPQAFGEDVQNNFHDLINVSRSNGWNNQLKNEPAVALFFERKWRPEAVRVGSFEADVLPHIGGSLGNVFTLGNMGAIFRFGRGLDGDYGPPQIRPTLSGLPSVNNDEDFGWYLFAGGEGRAVLRNIFLDGNTFADSHNIAKEPFVGSLQVGFSVSYKRVRLVFSHVYLTKEFKVQRRADRYGTVTLSTRF